MEGIREAKNVFESISFYILSTLCFKRFNNLHLNRYDKN